MEDIEVTSQEDSEESLMEEVDNKDALDKLRSIYEKLNNDMYGDVTNLLLELLNVKITVPLLMSMEIGIVIRKLRYRRGVVEKHANVIVN